MFAGDIRLFRCQNAHRIQHIFKYDAKEVESIEHMLEITPILLNLLIDTLNPILRDCFQVALRNRKQHFVMNVPTPPDSRHYQCCLIA